MRSMLALMGSAAWLTLIYLGCGDEGRPGDAGPMIHPDSAVDGPASWDAGLDVVQQDAPVPSCSVGQPCTTERACRELGVCLLETTYTIGGVEDPIAGHPDGPDAAIVARMWPGGYCSLTPVMSIDAPGACDPDEESSCGGCAGCLVVGEQSGRDLVVCLRRCWGSMTEQTCPSMEEQCLLGTNLCIGGCQSDDECAVHRPDSNGNGVIDPYDPIRNSGGDHLVYDEMGMWSCNGTTRRCEHPGVATASAGDLCVRSSECERNGRCISDAASEGEWPGGYCTKDGCTVPGNGCANDGVCQERRIGIDWCLAPCDFAQEPMADRLGAGGHGQGCRPGYTCYWNGIDPVGTPDSGGCAAGNYNAVTTPNTGAPCTDNEDCYSPYGAGLCGNSEFWLASGYCTMFDCGADGMPPDVCGPNTQCVAFYEDVTGCVSNCTTAADCNPGYGCVQYTMDAPSKVCFPLCLADEDCRTGETCMIPAGYMSGTCG